MLRRRWIHILRVRTRFGVTAWICETGGREVCVGVREVCVGVSGSGLSTSLRSWIKADARSFDVRMPSSLGMGVSVNTSGGENDESCKYQVCGGRRKSARTLKRHRRSIR